MEYNGCVSINDTKGKYIFWDIDGTLAPFRFYGHVSDPLGTHHGMSIVDIEQGVFYDRMPSKLMTKVVKECAAKKQIILGHCHAQKEIDDKHKWVKKYLPEITDIILIADEVSKTEMILDYCKKNDILIKDVIFVDDKISLVQEAEKAGITAFHSSSFLDWDYQ